jgi:hypothetical protein
MPRFEAWQGIMHDRANVSIRGHAISERRVK